MSREYQRTQGAEATVIDGRVISVHGNWFKASELAWAACGPAPYVEGAVMNPLNIGNDEPVSVLIKPIKDLQHKETFLDKDKLQEIIIRAGEQMELQPDKSYTYFVETALAGIIDYITQQNNRENCWTQIELWRLEGQKHIQEQREKAEKENNPFELPFD